MSSTSPVAAKKRSEVKMAPQVANTTRKRRFDPEKSAMAPSTGVARNMIRGPAPTARAHRS